MLWAQLAVPWVLVVVVAARCHALLELPCGSCCSEKGSSEVLVFGGLVSVFWGKHRVLESRIGALGRPGPPQAAPGAVCSEGGLGSGVTPRLWVSLEPPPALFCPGC